MAGKLVDVIAKFNPFRSSETSVSLKDKVIQGVSEKRKFVQGHLFCCTITEPGLPVPSPGKVGHTTRVYVP